MQQQTNEFYSKAYGAMQHYGQINTRLWKKCAEQQLEFLQLCGEYGERGSELWTNGKGLPEILAAQSSLAMEFTKNFAGHCGAGVASFMEAGTQAMSAFDVFKGYWTPTPVAGEEGAELPARAPKMKAA